MNSVPAACGWRWVLTGFALFRRNPPMWAFLVFSYIMLMQLLGMIPVVGWIAATLLIPAFSASFMIVSRELDRGKKLQMGLLFSGFRTNLISPPPSLSTRVEARRSSVPAISWSRSSGDCWGEAAGVSAAGAGAVSREGALRAMTTAEKSLSAPCRPWPTAACCCS